jgi:hypothetical protein
MTAGMESGWIVPTGLLSVHYPNKGVCAMPRRKRARRFDPRPGVSQQMLETECEYVGHEFNDYLVLSIYDLRERLKLVRDKIDAVEAVIQSRLVNLPDRERLAIRSMMARDFYHMAALYELFLATAAVTDSTGRSKLTLEELTADDEPAPAVPFREWLFDPDPATT